MDLSAEEQGRLSQDEETPDLDQTVAGDVERRLEGTGASEHQFQKAISAWRSELPRRTRAQLELR